jgi:DNA-binding NarL/FixJ family response regulator
LLANGKTDTEIASRLNLTANTAHYHVKQVLARLDLKSREGVYQRLIGLSQAAS